MLSRLSNWFDDVLSFYKLNKLNLIKLDLMSMHGTVESYV